MTEATTTPGIGERMRDGTVYAGISPDTGRAMYTTLTDAPLTYTFNEAADYAARLNLAESDPDKRTWHVPTRGELNVLYNNHAAIGNFDLSGSLPAGWYWSSSEGHSYNGCLQRFSGGKQRFDDKFSVASVRCIR